MSRGRWPWRSLYPLCALGVAIHILGDVITAYGTQIFAPLLETRFTLYTTFIVDPYFTGIIAAGLAATRLFPPRHAARAALLLLAAYVGFQGYLHHQAMSLAEQYARQQGISQARLYALPQPPWPFNWKLMVVDGDVYREALVNLAARTPAPERPGAGWFSTLIAAYQPPDALAWTTRHRFGDTPEARSLARLVWDRKALAGFRRFAAFPALYRMDWDGTTRCVWFTDLRFALPGQTPHFRYGMCRREGAGEWRLFRLRRASPEVRQPLEPAVPRS